MDKVKSKKLLERGLEFIRQNRIELAEEQFIKSIEEDFDNFESLHHLGTIYLRRKQWGIATQFFSRSLAIYPNNFAAWNNMGNCYKAVNHDEDARMCWVSALKFKGRDPFEYADVYNNLATIHVNNGTPEKGIEFCQKAIELNPNHPDAHWNLALMYLEQGKYSEGFDLYQWGFKNNIRLNRSYGKDVKTWNGEKDGTVVVWGEQGIGDEIMFASIIPDLIKDAKRVIFDCHPRLLKIFQKSFPEVTCYGTRKEDLLTWVENEKDIKYQTVIGDLAKHYRRSLTDFKHHDGYLKADPERIEHYKQRLARKGSKPKVGISWMGGGVKTRRDLRSVELGKWEPILKNKDVDFISLQYTPEAYSTISEVEDKIDCNIYHWPNAVQTEDYAETAALVSALDLVITVNTAIHHLAGGLGKECWTLTPKAKAWRYWSPSGDHSRIPWYPSVRQYQQKESGDWDFQINKIALNLKDKF